MVDGLEQSMNVKHRVIVQLSKTTPEDNGRYAPITSIFQAPLRPEKNDPYIAVDYNMLLINKNQSSYFSGLNKQQLQFDCVCNGFEARARQELTNMMDQVFLQHQNCCMIRCTAFRDNSVAVLNHLLVVEVNKRLQANHMTLHNIKCELYELRKFDVVNLLGNNVKEKRFQGTMDLQRWLNNDYVHLVSGVQGHACIDIVFSYADRRHRAFSVKFAYMQFVASKLDTEARAVLRNRLENIHKKPRGNNSVLMDTIRDYLSSRNNMKLWMFFDIPVYKNSISLSDEMVKIASAAYIGFENMLSGSKSQDSTGDLEIVLPYDDLVAEDPAYLKSLQTKKFTTAIASSMTEYNNLSTWYTKIDESFQHVVTTMQAYYDCKYNIRIKRLCSDLHRMMAYNEFETVADDKDLSSLYSEEDQSDESIHLLKNCLLEYRNAVAIFRSLIDEISQSKRYESLKVYLRTKNFDLLRNSMDFKMKKLLECQKGLARTINEEMDLIKSLKNPNAVDKN
ncbi:uncharacterized protein ACN427_007883 [Glossina fuscipes fuscipes]